jgi:hypothetical protein
MVVKLMQRFTSSLNEKLVINFIMIIIQLSLEAETGYADIKIHFGKRIFPLGGRIFLQNENETDCYRDVTLKGG